MKNTLAIALLLAACAFLISLVYNPLLIPSLAGNLGNPDAPTVELAGETIHVTLADTAKERAQGLSGKDGLARDEGMLFVFPKDGVYSFWMKDMRFAIDIVWISNSGEVVDIRESVPPESYPAAFTPRTEARYVIELPAGWVNEHSVAIGDVVRL